jgi:hypothetical protein
MVGSVFGMEIGDCDDATYSDLVRHYEEVDDGR